jgi:small subunit ribosomal protein S7
VLLTEKKEDLYTELKKVSNLCLEKKLNLKKTLHLIQNLKSTIIPKLINNIMYDGKRGVAAKIVYEAIEKIKTKPKDEPINIFNEAINNI